MTLFSRIPAAVRLLVCLFTFAALATNAGLMFAPELVPDVLANVFSPAVAGVSMAISVGSVHVDSALSDVAFAYANRNFIANALSPIVLTDKRSGKFFTRSRRDVSRVVNDRLGPRSPANEFSYSVGTSNFSVEDRGLKDVIPRTLTFNADAPIKPDVLAIENLTQGLMLARERRIAVQYTTTANYAAANVVTPTAGWSNTTTSTPLLDINTAIAALPASGVEVRKIAWCSLPVWNNLRKHPEILALKGMEKGQVSRADLAQFFELDEIFVSDTSYDTANEGQSASYSRVWGTTLFGVAAVPVRPVGDALYGFSFTFRSDDGGTEGVQVRRWIDESIGKGGSEWAQVEFSDDEVIVQNDMAAVINGV